ncbi:ABC transporter ATP-binding protein [Paraburkholderia sp. Ac-20342]|uniref:ABC transporter ATP-binding protein n=1 Tax=Paraburkholderia sp. Ac-20342 TaxID=2703889 RepID=UPI00197D7C75|nr:ABC transporter ATP-binding protein [Paraburkholderia sp. Ac-20342]MBN3846294.1 ABC transporter ATP-binding protein [Paraburkholderia sp. Ac-20342]
MSKPIKLRVEGVSKRYGAAYALKETSLIVYEGEFLTLLGPSGSGKTTLLSILSGLSIVDSGEIWIDEKVATHTSVHERGIGMVFQNYALFPHLTIYENIAFPLRMRKISEKEISRKVGEVLEVVRLPQVPNRFPKELSGGQQQRIALARCAVYEPTIILMDEPLGALDKKLRDDMQLEIKRLHVELGTTIVYVTHDQEEAMSMSDRICLMRDGAIEQLGMPDDLHFRPVSRFAADFLGASNIFPADVLSIAGERIELRAFGKARVIGAAERPVEFNSHLVAFMIRPEHIRILEDGETANNVFSAMVTRTIMNGSITRHYVALENGTELVTAEFTLAPMRSDRRVGRNVRIGWSAEHTIVLPH